MVLEDYQPFHYPTPLLEIQLYFPGSDAQNHFIMQFLKQETIKKILRSGLEFIFNGPKEMGGMIKMAWAYRLRADKGSK